MDKSKLNIGQAIRTLEQKLEPWAKDTNLKNFLVQTHSEENYSTLSNKFSNLNFTKFSTIKVPEKCEEQKLNENKEAVDKKKQENEKKEDQKDKVKSGEKFNDLQWFGDNPSWCNKIVGCTDKGRIIMFNADNGEKICEKYIDSIMLNACAVEQGENQTFAAGGFDGTIYLYQIKIGNKRNGNTADADDNYKKLTGHFGGISTIRFLNTSYMLSASYDSMIILWDINSQGKIINSFREHTSEVSGLDVCETNGNIFASGSGDTTAKLWDLREKKACVGTFQGCDSSINCVKFLPGRISTIAAGSEDSTIRIFDYRAFRELGCYNNEDDNNSINSVFFSKSGCLLFATASNKQSVYFWDLFGRRPTKPVKSFGINTSIQSSQSDNKVGFTKGSMDSTGRKIAVIQGQEIHIFK